MAGFAESAHGTDKASRIQKFDGLPELGRCTDEGTRNPRPSVPVIDNFVSSFGQAVEANPVLQASQVGQHVSRPKFMAKITITDINSDDNF